MNARVRVRLFSAVAAVTTLVVVVGAGYKFM
jgi:hypothetical protein